MKIQKFNFFVEVFYVWNLLVLQHSLLLGAGLTQGTAGLLPPVAVLAERDLFNKGRK
jgi:hypothetical protein